MRVGRLVATGHDSAGRSMVVTDTAVSAATLGEGVLAHFAWGRDDIASFPDDGRMPAHESPFPPPGGARLSFLTIAPGANETYRGFIVGSLGELADPGEPGFHRTPTLDIAVVLKGELLLEMDDGDPVTLGPGDAVVQNGTRHRWTNVGDGPVVLASVVLGAHDAGTAAAGAAR